MRLPKFEYFEPETIEEACSLLLKYKEDARVIAGGTDLLVHMKRKTVTPKALVNIKKITNLNCIDCGENEGLRIGALTAIHTVGTSSIVKDRFGILAQAAGSVGTPQIRHMATLGGNLCLDSRCFYYNRSRPWRQARPACYHTGGDICHVAKGSDRCQALFVADTVPALIALGAEVTIAGPDGDKQIALEEFYTGRGEQVNLLQPGQVVTQIRVPNLSSHAGDVYLKYSLRGAIDFPIVGVAAVIIMEPEDRVCHDAKIALIGVASNPVRALEAEGVIEGKEISDNLVEDVGKVILTEIHPITHMGIPAGYKRRLIEILTKRAVRQAWQQAKQV